MQQVLAVFSAVATTGTIHAALRSDVT